MIDVLLVIGGIFLFSSLSMTLLGELGLKAVKFRRAACDMLWELYDWSDGMSKEFLLFTLCI